MTNPQENLNELALFAGAGGSILGGKLLGWRTVCAVEWEPYAACVLAARQNDGFLPPFPIWDDVQTFDGRPWRGRVDVVSGGFPCQDISVAGKGAGITGERSGMWRHMARIVGEVRPRYVFVENSPALITRGLGVVLGDLAALGYDCRWTVLGAADVGAPHQRDRFWLVANARGGRRGQSKSRQVEQQRRAETVCASSDAEMAHTNGLRELQPQGSEQHERGWIGDGRENVADASGTGQLRAQQLEDHRGCQRGRQVSDDIDSKDQVRSKDVAHAECTRSQSRNVQCPRQTTEQFTEKCSHSQQYGSKDFWRSEP